MINFDTKLNMRAVTRHSHSMCDCELLKEREREIHFSQESILCRVRAFDCAEKGANVSK